MDWLRPLRGCRLPPTVACESADDETAGRFCKKGAGPSLQVKNSEGRVEE